MLYGTNLHYKPARGENPTALDKQAVLRKLFDDIAPRYQDRNGGYTRIIRGELRKGDGTQMGYIQLV
jgi:large subunit ribosomal protein L17